ncbi:MAG TPA: SDR family NAD(P)-dependent oxidoreductase [Candidatus Xenobia bacterium]|nr:SDR family NAD(P)-dependent oxidoreductase [Candidatus Xenobia bacterium]
MSAEKPVAVVTGASRGIGFAIAQELARRGYRLALVARNPASLEAAARKLAGESRTFVCDVREAAAVRSVFRDILAWAGRVDVLVNNAGIGGFGAIQELSEETWDNTLNTNLRGAFLCSRAVAPQMIRQRSGYIINIGSLAGKNFFAGAAAYCASKWGLMGLSKCMGEDLRGYGIRVSVICPGSVHTEFSPHAGKDPKKMLQPEDVARAVGWLLEQSPTSFVSEIELRPTQKP